MSRDDFGLDKFRPESERESEHDHLETSKARKLNLEGFSEADLIELRKIVDGKLPYRLLSEVNLVEQAVLHWRLLDSKMQEFISTSGIQANQLGTFANAVTTAQKNLAEMQDKRYNSEVIKQIENALVEAIELLPMEQQVQFMESYTEIIKKALEL